MKKDQKNKAAKFFGTSDDYKRPYEFDQAKTEPGPPKKVGRPKTGKSSNSNYVQVSAYVKKETHNNVKIALITDDKNRDFSQLVEELLSEWLKK